MYMGYGICPRGRICISKGRILHIWEYQLEGLLLPFVFDLTWILSGKFRFLAFRSVNPLWASHDSVRHGNRLSM